jgi:hypothetical protein
MLYQLKRRYNIDNVSIAYASNLRAINDLVYEENNVLELVEYNSNMYMPLNLSYWNRIAAQSAPFSSVVGQIQLFAIQFSAALIQLNHYYCLEIMNDKRVINIHVPRSFPITNTSRFQFIFQL